MPFKSLGMHQFQFQSIPINSKNWNWCIPKYARRVQEISHSIYSHMTNSTQNYDFNPDKITIIGRKKNKIF
jgi:hypothetical protein